VFHIILDPWWLEGVAEALYREIGAEPDEPQLQLRLARALLGADAVEIVPPGVLKTTRARLALVEGRWRIFVRRQARAEMAFGLAHEIGHWALLREGYQGDDEESCADYLAGALIAPRRAFLQAIGELGRDLPQLAERFGTTESLVALRYGESTSVPLALVRPGLVRVRSQLEFVWPSEEVILRWARGRPPLGLAKTRLTDDRRRVVLAGDEIDEAIEDAG
jgi:hypothetical protein